MKVSIPLKTGTGQNLREHWRARDRRVKNERWETHIALVGRPKPALPCTVLLRRVAPSNGLDRHDNLPGSVKAVVDQIAAWLTIDDRDPRVTWAYDQRRGPWGVEIEFVPTTAEAA
jgi:hypothetical protein